MARSVLILTLAAALAGNAAQAQQGRAAQALNGVPGTGNTFTQGTVNEVVTPFETDTPPESGYDPNSFDQRIYDTRQQDSDQGRVLRATEDSAAVRPEVDIDAQGPLFDDANWAHENAEDVAGQYFTSESGQCTTPSVPVSQVFDRFCESLPARETRTCDLIRKIWVDRTDTYRCDKRAAQYVKVCNKDITYACQVNTTTAACLRNNIAVEGAASWWEGNRLVIELPRAGNTGGGTVTGQLAVRNFTIRVADHAKLEQAILREVRADGAIQVLVDGTPVGTWGGQGAAGFGSGGGNCAQNDRDGKLTVLTRRAGHSYCESRYPGPRVFSYLDKRNPPINVRVQNMFRYRVVDEGNSDAAIRKYCDPINHNLCPVFSNITNAPVTNLNVLRFLSLNQHATVNPEGARAWAETDVQVRVAHLKNRWNGGWARIAIEVTGPCCDAFQAVEDELCE